jgi:hypothetical protein
MGLHCWLAKIPMRTFAKHPLILYDVNSMYAWAMTQEIPDKVYCQLGSNYRGKIPFNRCGFVRCSVFVPDMPIPPLPYRQGKLLFPTGYLTGTWSTVELRIAVKLGVKILQHHESVYFKTQKPFVHFVETMFKFRDKGREDYNEAMSTIAKLIVNSTYGKFGMGSIREAIHINPDLAEVLHKRMRPIETPVNVPVFVEALTVETDYMLPHIAAWITALARVRLLEGLLLLPAESVYYCDTDSIVTSARLPDSIVGTKLGQFKVEEWPKKSGGGPMDNIVKAEFVGPKVYSLTGTKKGQVKAKAKGFSQFGGGSKLTPDSIAKLKEGGGLLCSRFSKCRTVIRGQFGLLKGEKHLLMKSEKRIFSKDGSSVPISIPNGPVT